MILKQLSVNDGHKVYDMLQRIGANENAFFNEVNGMSFQEYKNWLIRMNDWSKGDNLPNGYVKLWTFWLVNDEGVYCGYGKIREKLTDESRKFGGNIGFAIDPLYRGQGYGYILYSLLLKKAKELSIKEIISTVEKYNYPSKIIHEKCGGVLFQETDIRWYYKF